MPFRIECNERTAEALAKWKKTQLIEFYYVVEKKARIKEMSEIKLTSRFKSLVHRIAIFFSCFAVVVATLRAYFYMEVLISATELSSLESRKHRKCYKNYVILNSEYGLLFAYYWPHEREWLLSRFTKISPWNQSAEDFAKEDEREEKIIWKILPDSFGVSGKQYYAVQLKKKYKLAVLCRIRLHIFTHATKTLRRLRKRERERTKERKREANARVAKKRIIIAIRESEL